MAGNISYNDFSKYLHLDDDGDLCWSLIVKSSTVGKMKGSPDNYGYKHFHLFGKRWKFHRVIYCLNNKCDLDSSIEVDHIDLDKTNNKPSNLRVASRHDNQQNRGKNKNNTSGYKGVCLHSKTGCYFGRVLFNGKYYSTKYHKLAVDAHKELCKIRANFKSIYVNNGE